ncbi:MAG: 30S ribosome-binding factor RbfA [Gemmatimonadales bacterium]|nr:30S ribosome-binding factor RbfA [Gemmatimonadales bacterium]
MSSRRRGGSGGRRSGQVGEVVRQVVGEALLRGDVRDPRVGLVTLTDVRVTPDLSHARLLVAVRGDEAERQAALAGLASAAGLLRRLVAEAMSTRIVPELHFELDRGLEHAARIDALLAGLARGGEEA